jgi:hypothetical protein
MPESKASRRLHGGAKSASIARVKADSRDSGGAFAPALTRTMDADTIKPRKSRLTVKTVAHFSDDPESIGKRAIFA